MDDIYRVFSYVFFFNDTATTEIYTLSLHDALPIFLRRRARVDRRDHRAHRRRIRGHRVRGGVGSRRARAGDAEPVRDGRSEEHTSELQSRQYLVCRLLLEKKKTNCTDLLIT